MKSGQVNELLARRGIAGTETAGTATTAAACGGTTATLHIEPDERYGPVLTLTIEGRHVSRICPLDRQDARSLVDVFANHHLLPQDESMKQMVAHLLLKTSELYLEAGAQELTLTPVHLHPSAYHIGGADIAFRSGEPHVKARLAPHAHDRRKGLMHRPGPLRRPPDSIGARGD